MRYGYARVSTETQSLDIQVRELTAAGCQIIRQEKLSGRSVEGRDELQTLRQFLRKGDELWVSRLDRLARSVHDLAVMVKEFKERGVTLRSIHENVDTSTPSGEAFVYMAGIFGQLDYDVRRERQMAGIARAQSNGVYQNRKPPTPKPGKSLGRPRKDLNPDQAKAAMIEMGASAAARKFGVSKATFYRTIRLEVVS